MSLQNTTKENFYTPVPTIGKYDDDDDDTVDTSTGSTEEEELDDLGNAKEFHEYMEKKGHVFKTCKGKLLWYDPNQGFYEEENSALKLKLGGFFSECPVLEQKYKASVSKHNALYSMLKTRVPPEPDFYEKSQENTKGFLAFNNCIWDYNERKALPFDPKFYFTFKSNVNYKEHDPKFELEVRKLVVESIFGEGEKGELFMKLLARALAGEVEDKRFIVLLGKTNSGKGTLTQLLGDCFGLGNFVGNYDAKNLQLESKTKSWLLQNKNSRIILANEINAEKPILANNIKLCANGGEAITTQAKYENERNFIPQGTMLLFANEMPRIKGTDAGNAVSNRIVYLETEFSYLETQKYEEMKDDPKVRLADPRLKTEYLKRQDVQEAFARLICNAYVPEAPPLPECCKKKALEYKPEKSLKERLEEVVDITGEGCDYVPASDLAEDLSVSTTALGIEMKKLNGVKKVKQRFEGVQKVVYRGVKWRDANTTQEYEDGTSAEVSFFADVDTVMTSPMKDGKVEGLMTENAELRAEVAELKEALKAKEQFPEGYDKALKTCLETKSETVKTATMKKALEGLLLEKKRLLVKVKGQGDILAEKEETIVLYKQEFARFKNQEEMSKAEPELLDYELYEAEDKNRELVALVRYIERGFGKGLLDADGKVLPEILKEAKATAPVDTFDTE